MTARVPCRHAPGPLEAYAAQFDDPFIHAAQRRTFRDYLGMRKGGGLCRGSKQIHRSRELPV